MSNAAVQSLIDQTPWFVETDVYYGREALSTILGMIEGLSSEAGVAGDPEQVALCEQALELDQGAIDACVLSLEAGDPDWPLTHYESITKYYEENITESLGDFEDEEERKAVEEFMLDVMWQGYGLYRPLMENEWLPLLDHASEYVRRNSHRDERGRLRSILMPGDYPDGYLVE